MSVNAVFDQCWAVTLPQEGGATLSLDRADCGNWTGGAVGEGELRGTKFGISAAAFPNVDIAGLQPSMAAAIAFQAYFLAMRCGDMPAPLAMLVFDAAYNNGPASATRMLQTVLGLKVDGDLGKITRTAIGAIDPARTDELCCAFQAARLLHEAGGPAWQRYAHDMAQRICAVLWQSATLASAARAAAAAV